MIFKDYNVTINDSDRRLDRVLSKLFFNISHQLLQKNIRNGFIRLNGKKTDPTVRVKEGDIINCAGKLLEFSTQNTKTQKDYQCSIPVIFQNQNVIVFNKPYNISVQPSKSNSFSLCSYVNDFFSTTDSLSFKPGPIHRLDRKTTGLVIFSQSLIGAREVSSAISNSRIEKTYLGLVQGDVENEQLWEDVIEQDIKNNTNDNSFKKMTISQTNQSDLSKKAITKIIPISKGIYKAEEKKITISFVKFKIITGRKHQIRLQSSIHGFPLIGDTAYNGIKINENQDFFLHAYRLDFPDDIASIFDNQTYLIAPIPNYFLDMLKKYLMIDELSSIL